MKFEGMGIPPSRSLQESRLSALSSTLPSSHSPSLSSSFSSPRPLSSALSTRSEDSSVSEPGLDVQSSLDRLLPCVSALLSRFDQVNQITEDVHNLEIKLEEAQTRRRKKQSNRDKGAERFQEPAKSKELEGETGEVRLRKTGFLYPKPRISLPSSFSFAPCTLHSSAALVGTFRHTCRTYSESESASFQPQGSGNNYASEAAKLASGVCAVNPAGSLGYARFPRRRAWHSGSSHSADASQRVFQAQGEAAPCGNGGEYLAFTNTRPRSEEGVRGHINDGVPVKRKAWTEQD